MDYPKYIEFEDGSVLVFSPILTHSDVARWVDKAAVSAGMACFPTIRRESYKFFGTSTSLGLDANKNLTLANPTWFGGLLKNDPWRSMVFSTNQAVAEQRCEGHGPLTLVGLQDEYDTVAYLPDVEGATDQEIARFSGLLECSAFGQPVRRATLVTATAPSNI